MENNAVTVLTNINFRRKSLLVTLSVTKQFTPSQMDSHHSQIFDTVLHYWDQNSWLQLYQSQASNLHISITHIVKPCIKTHPCSIWTVQYIIILCNCRQKVKAKDKKNYPYELSWLIQALCIAAKLIKYVCVYKQLFTYADPYYSRKEKAPHIPPFSVTQGHRNSRESIGYLRLHQWTY